MRQVLQKALIMAVFSRVIDETAIECALSVAAVQDQVRD
jgi:hypothetical protein